METRSNINSAISIEMANLNSLINSYVTSNANAAITGAGLNSTLQEIKESIDTLTRLLNESAFIKETDTSNEIEEGTNPDKWFFSEAHHNFRFSTKKTDDLTEGVTNLYFTNARADARINALRPTQASVAQPTGNQTVVIPSGGGTVNLIDAEARTAINNLINRLTSANIIS